MRPNPADEVHGLPQPRDVPIRATTYKRGPSFGPVFDALLAGRSQRSILRGMQGPKYKPRLAGKAPKTFGPRFRKRLAGKAPKAYGPIHRPRKAGRGLSALAGQRPTKRVGRRIAKAERALRRIKKPRIQPMRRIKHALRPNGYRSSSGALLLRLLRRLTRHLKKRPRETISRNHGRPNQ